MEQASDNRLLLEQIVNLRNDLRAIGRTMMNIASASLHIEQNAFHQALLRDERYADPKRLARFERQVFSQNGEDGVIQEIFQRIGTQDRFFVEVGVGNGLECNSAYLLRRGWRGAWIDGDRQALSDAANEFKEVIDGGRLRIVPQAVSGRNIAAVLRQASVPDEFDLLSLDIDRNTYHLWNALGHLKPRVVVIEYNAIIPPDEQWFVEEVPEAGWNGSSYFGASLKAYQTLAEKYGYSLVGCETTGVNAFFVRNDLVQDRFAAPFTAENHYEPPRYFLSRCSGFPRRFSDAADRRNKPL
jgi:hypothetical protein